MKNNNKKLNSKLFNKEQTISKEEQGCVVGGNNSDVTYYDTDRNGKLDLGVDSVIDVFDSSKALDKAAITHKP